MITCMPAHVRIQRALLGNVGAAVKTHTHIRSWVIRLWLHIMTIVVIISWPHYVRTTCYNRDYMGTYVLNSIYHSIRVDGIYNSIIGFFFFVGKRLKGVTHQKRTRSCTQTHTHATMKDVSGPFHRPGCMHTHTYICKQLVNCTVLQYCMGTELRI